MMPGFDKAGVSENRDNKAHDLPREGVRYFWELPGHMPDTTRSTLVAHS